ncbi:MAG: 5'-nucleotidase C-terminal domain-containing protein [Prevotella sp.]|nr:5'-nucleotidase C-terminal domain-containing protein [Prevotella sp.]
MKHLNLHHVSKTAAASLLVLGLSQSCATRYHMTGIERSRILVDSRFDRQPDAGAQRFIAPYQHEVDSIMKPVVGKAAKYMATNRPESELSNLMADILVWGSKPFGEKPDLGVYNMGGIRAALAEGEITWGNIVDMAPFENKICFLTLTGEKLLELFAQMASRGGEGISHGTELRISDRKLVSARLHGQEIDPQGTYRVATLDYLAQGNDGLLAFKSGTDVVSPQDVTNNVRFIIRDYFLSETAKGRLIDSQLEGRVVLE